MICLVITSIVLLSAVAFISCETDDITIEESDEVNVSDISASEKNHPLK